MAQKQRRKKRARRDSGDDSPRRKRFAVSGGDRRARRRVSIRPKPCRSERTPIEEDGGARRERAQLSPGMHSGARRPAGFEGGEDDDRRNVDRSAVTGEAGTAGTAASGSRKRSVVMKRWRAAWSGAERDERERRPCFAGGGSAKGPFEGGGGGSPKGKRGAERGAESDRASSACRGWRLIGGCGSCGYACTEPFQSAAGRRAFILLIAAAGCVEPKRECSARQCMRTNARVFGRPTAVRCVRDAVASTSPFTVSARKLQPGAGATIVN